MKRALLLMLLCLPAFASDPRDYGVSVTYRVLNGATTPESMSDQNIGVLVFLKTSNGAIANYSVRLLYVDSDGVSRDISKTVTRRGGRGGFDPTPSVVLFDVPVSRVYAVYAEGFTTTQIVGIASGN